MIYLVAIVAILGFLVWRGRVGRVLRGEWRAPAAIVSIGLFAAAGFEGLRGGVPDRPSSCSSSACSWWGQRGRPRPRAARRAGSGMSLADARALLGVGRTPPRRNPRRPRPADPHQPPDTGGTTGLAFQLNAARDRLLKEQGKAGDVSALKMGLISGAAKKSIGSWVLIAFLVPPGPGFIAAIASFSCWRRGTRCEPRSAIWPERPRFARR